VEGWEELYSYDMVFSEDRREFDEDRFWFQDGLHYAEPYHSFDALYHGFSIAGFKQASARLFELVRGTCPQLSDQTIAKMGGGTLLDMGPLHGPTAYPPLRILSAATGTANSFTVTATSTAGHTFSISLSNTGTLTRACLPVSRGGCNASGTW
jgi:hypothetical protein